MAQNALVDYISRIIDFDDWGVGLSVFYWLDDLWGPHVVDRFANSNNAKCTRFNSRFWCPGTEAVDAFTVLWGGEVSWLCPPVCRVIAHIKACPCNGTLVVPAWPSAPYCPLLFPFALVQKPWIVDMVYLPWFEGLITPGRCGSSLPKADLLAIKVDSKVLSLHTANS